MDREEKIQLLNIIDIKCHLLELQTERNEVAKIANSVNDTYGIAYCKVHEMDARTEELITEMKKLTSQFIGEVAYAPRVSGNHQTTCNKSECRGCF